MNNKYKFYLCLSLAIFYACVGLSPQLVYAQQKILAPADIITSAAEYDYPPYSMATAEGTATGFSVELLAAVVEVMGREVAFKVGAWSEVKQLLIERTIQVLPLVGRTPEREKLFDFTFPYLNMHGTIIVRDDVKDIRTLHDLNGRTVAVLEGDNAEEFLRRSPVAAEIVTTRSFETALRNLANGQYDAVVIQKLLAMQLLQQTGIQNLRAVGPPLDGFVQSFCFAVQKGDAQLLSLLNEGLSIVLADGTFNRLRAKWFSPIESSSRSRIIVGGDNNYPPYEFLDENGNPTGFNVDLMRAVARLLKLDIDIQLDAWKDIRQGVNAGRIDLVQGMFYSAARDKEVDFSTAHSIVGHSIVGRTGSDMPQNMSELVGKSILVMDGDIMHDVAIRHGYEQQLVLVESQEEALRLLAAGKHDYVLMAKLPALYWIKKNAWNNLVVGESSIISPEYSFAALHGNEALLAQISDVLVALKESGQYRNIYSKWFAAYEAPATTNGEIVKYALGFAIPVLLLLIGVFVWNKLLKGQVAQRTAQLQQEMAERKILEEQLRQAEKMQAIGQLAGGIAHDFNNQLSGILGFASLLENKLTDSKHQKHLQRIKQSAQRAANLTQQLLAFSRRGKHLATPTDMKKIIIDVATILEHSIDKKIQIHTRFNTTETIVVGDPNQLQNALLNVALNARDAIIDTGNIEFFSEVVTLDRGYCDKSPYDLTPGVFLKVCLLDDGAGMDEETQARIFEPFFTTKEVGRGTGMGLASVYGTINEHKGMIHVSSKVGRGTTFCLYLPLANESQQEAVAEKKDLPVIGQARILLVDDEEDVRAVAAEMLEDLGYQVTLCVSGQEAIEYYRKSWMQIDLVILDMMMPGLSGKETFLAQQKINPQIRAILLSGYSLNEQVQDILDAGVKAFMGKPFEQLELSQVVAASLK